ncbi:hypothetical protein EB796_008160 [Bugula neritina]|uniref:Methyltransferase type 11 domain-containing protein n=1 Tax=Bugula neritina TaxID=10212 RepID=A0A7J7K5P5_BUGNE|nr:hypothetical protein EB796_008160 [Bugula neritina]
MAATKTAAPWNEVAKPTVIDEKQDSAERLDFYNSNAAVYDSDMKVYGYGCWQWNWTHSREDTYDGVVTCGTFVAGHMKSEVLVEICNILKPGGYFVMVIFCDGHARHILGDGRRVQAEFQTHY